MDRNPDINRTKKTDYGNDYGCVTTNLQPVTFNCCTLRASVSERAI